jgi:hypothetical protein
MQCRVVRSAELSLSLASAGFLLGLRLDPKDGGGIFPELNGIATQKTALGNVLLFSAVTHHTITDA